MKRQLLLILLCIVSIKGFTQESNTELLKKLVEKGVLTQNEADEISNEPAVEAKPVLDKNPIEKGTDKIRHAFNTPYLRFAGYAMFTYQYKQYNRVHHDARPRLVYVSLSGNLTSNLRYFVLMEFADPRLNELNLEWTPFTALSVKGGQMKVPFSFENQISPINLETILNTRSASCLTGMIGDPLQFSESKGYNKTGRDIGIQVSGSFLKVGSHNLLQYAAGMFQGTGMGVEENNNTKDFAGTLSLQPVKDFRIGGGLYAGQAYYIKAGNTVKGDHVRNRWAISADYKNDRFYARSEWIHGNDGGIKKEGLYGTALWYIIPQKLNIVGKVDYYNQNKDINSEVIDYTASVSYYFWEQCRFQVCYTFSDYSKKWGGLHRTENAVQAQMQIVF